MNRYKQVLVFVALLASFPGVLASPQKNDVTVGNLDTRSAAILFSSQKGEFDQVKSLIAQKVPLSVQDDYGRTALHIAVEFEHSRIVQLLIESGADLESRTGRALHIYFGWTPLMSAANWGNAESAQFLVNAGANVNALETGSRNNFSVLGVATESGSYEVAEVLIKGGADIEAKSGTRLQTPLYFAVRQNKPKLVELLVQQDANVSVLDKENFSIMHAAAMTGNHSIAQFLIENGAPFDTNTTGGSVAGATPLHLAVYGSHLEFTKLLVRKGANVNGTSKYGYTPLRMAVDNGNFEISKFLVKNGANVNLADINGLTPLHSVAQTEYTELAKFLIASGSEINSPDKYSKFTPLDYAMDGEPEMIEFLEDKGGICTSC